MKSSTSPGYEIKKYSAAQSPEFSKICEILRIEISKQLKQAKIYYSMPVWFIDKNPIVGYKASKTSVNLLFWSGQSFDEPDLKPAGKFKAAQIKFKSERDIDKRKLRRWLNAAKSYIWDYNHLRTNGRLTKFHLHRDI
jgi:hypothetical protein